MSLRSLFMLPALLGLAACASPPNAEAPANGACNAGPAQPYIGKAANAATVEAARRAAGAQRVRTLKPGQMVTMEFLEGRLNLYLDANGNIERIACG